MQQNWDLVTVSLQFLVIDSNIIHDIIFNQVAEDDVIEPRDHAWNLKVGFDQYFDFWGLCQQRKSMRALIRI